MAEQDRDVSVSGRVTTLRVVHKATCLTQTHLYHALVTYWLILGHTYTMPWWLIGLFWDTLIPCPSDLLAYSGTHLYNALVTYWLILGHTYTMPWWLAGLFWDTLIPCPGDLLAYSRTHLFAHSGTHLYHALVTYWLILGHTYWLILVHTYTMPWWLIGLFWDTLIPGPGDLLVYSGTHLYHALVTWSFSVGKLYYE